MTAEIIDIERIAASPAESRTPFERVCASEYDDLVVTRRDFLGRGYTLVGHGVAEDAVSVLRGTYTKPEVYNGAEYDAPCVARVEPYLDGSGRRRWMHSSVSRRPARGFDTFDDAVDDAILRSL